MNQTHRPLCMIAASIRAKWPKPYFGAVPYIEAMSQLDGINENFMCDSARDIVLRFLGNAATWRGPDAKAIKAELKAMLK